MTETYLGDGLYVSFALFKDGKQISKAHRHRGTVVIEAFERGLFLTWRYGTKIGLADGVEIREVKSL
jgi:hypothetical protein